jgi:hypothetical protein
MITSEVELVLKAIQPILHHQAASVDVRADKEREYDVQLHEAIDKTVHSSLCGSVRAISFAFSLVTNLWPLVLHRQEHRQELVRLSVELIPAVVLDILGSGERLGI